MQFEATLKINPMNNSKIHHFSLILRLGGKFVAVASFLTLAIFSPLVSSAQTYDQDYTVKYINDQLESSCELFAEKKNVRIEYSGGGEVVRIDYLFPESINIEEISYSESEGAVVIACYEKAGKCIERDVVKRDSKLLYNRTNLATGCSGEDCESLVNAVKHLLLLFTDKHLERTEPF
ncbi:MAG: hypothetical protein HN542_02395 [Flavobacteriales bacterium]|nr:hypothetical protein [Flavobacteriales bacterium]NCG29974.1 hypothetical protein [Bacteroidota bacterium]MBT4705360.1 hypothetical protein [Flavobacteriales bacterium]MBT5976837.1 hypothetical protein [Flavobacteriales bacterium]MBT6978211.1 hypothetical protein [Flavobacteriales bacterium]